MLVVSVLIIRGTAGPLLPFDGSTVAFRRGEIIPTSETVPLWSQANQTHAVPVIGDLPDSDAKDGCRVHWSSCRGGRNNSEVLLYMEDGAGHTWPGGSQYLPKSMVGSVCRDFDTTRVIWDFFRVHPRP